MDIIKIGTELLLARLGNSSNVSSSIASGALKKLLCDADGKLNIDSLVSKFATQDGLSDVVKSWLGDGSNSSISGKTINSVFGSNKIDSFAQDLGIDSDTASSSLSSVLPELIDKFSSGGNLLGNSNNLFGLAKKLF